MLLKPGNFCEILRSDKLLILNRFIKKVFYLCSFPIILINMHTELISLGSIIILGIAAQWLAWRLKFPSIILLLLFGLIAGPVTGFIRPNELFGNALLPFVSVAVAVILFEGGLTLRLKELKSVGKVILSLITIGVLITGVLSALAAHFLLDVDWKISILLGAVLTVTGPTVIGPLLRHIRPTGKVSEILKWEGIVIDPIGALLALLVYEVIVIGEIEHAGAQVLFVLGKTVFIGSIVGFAFAWLLVFLLKKFWIPDFLHETVTLSLVIGAFILSDTIQSESGLIATTLMGLVLDNQKLVSIKHIVEFKENLRVLIISVLFITLSSMLNPTDLDTLTIGSFVLLFLLIFLIRPLSVFASTIASGLTWKEKTFLSWMAPRGIVAAAVSSIFALRLAELGVPQSEIIVPTTFLIIIGTVAVYGFTAPMLAQKLKVAQADPQGALIVGAHSWGIKIAKVLQENGFKVAIVDTNHSAIYKARMEEIPVYHGSALAKDIFDEIDFNGIGKLIALTANNEANALAVLHFAEFFGREELYQISPDQNENKEDDKFSPQHLRGRFIFGKTTGYSNINKKFQSGWITKSSKLTDEYTFEQFKERYGQDCVPLFLITDDKKLMVFSSDMDFEPKTGHMIIALVKDIETKKETKN